MEPNPYQSPQFYAPDGERRSTLTTGGAEFAIDCECGATIPVLASDAGGSVTCPCSRILRVPRLSQLRVALGLAAHETNVRDTIARMIGEKALPWGVCCAVTGMPTEDVMWFDVQCESTYTKTNKRWGMYLIVISLLLPLGFFVRLLGLSMLTEDPERLGRDIVVGIPLRVGKESQAKLKRWWSQRRLRKALSSVPIYHELFREHPAARIYPK
jgi:hypothetical protein